MAVQRKITLYECDVCRQRDVSEDVIFSVRSTDVDNRSVEFDVCPKCIKGTLQRLCNEVIDLDCQVHHGYGMLRRVLDKVGVNYNWEEPATD